MQNFRSVYAALVMVQVFFATLPIAVKIALRDLSSPSIALLRVAGGAALFLILQRIISGERVRSGADYARLALYALFGVIANQLLYITALSLTTATTAQTLIATGPAMTLLIAIALRRETASAMKWAGILLALAGALSLVGVNLTSGAALGNLLVILNVAAFSIYLVISRDILHRYDPLTVITWTFIFGAVGIAPWGISSVADEIGGISATTGWALLWIVAVPTVLAYYLNVWALQRVQASTVAVFVYIQPVVTGLLAAAILGERAPARLIPAAALIFLGVAITARERRRRGASPARQDYVEV